ncbi:MAG: glycosyltransferase family 4 protein [Gammaproteobacteria bacterium]|nr:glycosyltransferase family 4 protein [Gammaproteobacteria bacterium]
MKIIYNLDCIRAPMTGIGYYTQNMVLAMIHHYPEVEIIACRHNILLSKQEILEVCSQFTEAPKKAPAWKGALIEIINQFAFARTIIQWQYNCRHYFKLKKLTKDYLYHEPNFVFLPHDGYKILTIHDISMFSCPEFLPKGRAKFLQQQMRRGMQKADALIVSCQFIKDQTVSLLNIPEKKIHIIPPGANENFMPRPKNEVQVCLEKFSLVYKQFLLCVATLEPRKNLIRLINAYQTLPNSMQKKYPLVLVGNKGWLYEELLTLINESQSSTILLLRYVDEKTLFHLYSAAKAFVYPSLYEGFGLPVLEAMQSGLPVITSNVSSLPEVCGKAGILVNPLNESEIALAMEEILTANDAIYTDQVQRSLTQAKKFSWENFSKKLFDVYKKINHTPP